MRSVTTPRSSWCRRLVVALVPILAVFMGCKGSDASPEPLPPLARSDAPAAQCGETGHPDCPTQLWMKSTLQAYLRPRNFERLEGSLRALGARAPNGYAGWQEMAAAGAAAAAVADEAGVRNSCKACHDNHRAAFRQQDRAIALF